MVKVIKIKNTRRASFFYINKHFYSNQSSYVTMSTNMHNEFIALFLDRFTSLLQTNKQLHRNNIIALLLLQLVRKPLHIAWIFQSRPFQVDAFNNPWQIPEMPRGNGNRSLPRRGRHIWTAGLLTELVALVAHHAPTPSETMESIIMSGFQCFVSRVQEKHSLSRRCFCVR